MYLKAYIQKLVRNDPVVYEKSKFSFSFVNDLWSMSRKNLDLEYSHTLTNPVSCLHLKTLSQQAAIVLKNPLFSFVPTEEPE